jgi:hypothetical protein
MPQPNVNALHISAPLTNISVAYRQDASQFIATKVFPAVPVDHKTDLYWKIDKGDWFRDEARVRADATESVGSGYNLSTDTYNAVVRAIHKDIGNQARQNADAPFNLDQSATEFVTDRLLLQREAQFNRDFLTTGVWGTDIAGVAATPSASQFIQWSDYDNSDPIKTIKTWKRAVVASTGMLPNTLVLGFDVWDALQEHPAFIDKIKYTSSDVITEAVVAKYFGLQNIYVSQAVINSGKEGQSDSFDFITGKVALLAYVAPNPGLLTPTAGYTFEWKGVSGGLGSTIAVSKFPMLQLKADRVEGETAYDNKIVAADLGVFMSSVVA